MSTKMFCSLCLTAGLLGSVTMNAQSLGQTPSEQVKPSTTLRGRVLSQEGKPLALATVALLGADGVLLDGSVVGDDGTFALGRSLDRAVSLRVQMLGYETHTLQLQKGQYDVGDLRLKPSATQLGEVVVKGARRSAFKMQGTSLNASVASTSLANLPTAIEVLSALPFVKASKSSIEVQGRGTPIIYLGHRRISQDELLQLDPKDIKDIELILVPDASYPAGTPAVIRIKTKSILSKRAGVYLRSDLRQERDFSPYGLAQGYYETPKLSLKLTGISQTYHYYQERDLIVKTLDETPASTSALYVKDHGSTKMHYGYLNGIYRFNDKHEVGMGYGLLAYPARRNMDTNLKAKVHISGAVPSEHTSLLEGHQLATSYRHELNAYYHGKLSDQWTLHAEGNVFVSQPQRSTTTSTVHYTLPIAREDWNKGEQSKSGESYAWRAYLEYALKGGKLQIGQDGSITRYKQTYRQLNVAHQGLFPQSENLHRQSNLGAFATWSRAWGEHISSQVGLRLEHQSTETTLNNKPSEREQQLYFFPTLSLSYNKGDFSTSLIYENSVRNPSYRQLRTDITYVNELFMETGNPNLKPRIENKLSLTAGYKDLSMMLATRWVKNGTMMSEKRYDRDPQRILIYQENYSYSNYGVQLSYAPHIGVWRPTWAFYIDAQKLEYAGRRFNKPTLQLEWNNLLSLPRDWTLKGEVYWLTAGHAQNALVKSRWGIDLEASKQLGEHWQVSVMTRDLFRTGARSLTAYTAIAETLIANHQLHGYYELSLSYRLNAKANKYRGGQAGQAERNRF